MRIAGQSKCGFFPVPPQAMAALAQFLRVEDPARAVIVDPCCGNGEALRQLATLLSVPIANTYAAELDIDRGETAAKMLNGGTVEHPSDFLTMHATWQFASLVWCNPPYDAELGGGAREEGNFLSQVTHIIKPGGVLMLALPGHVLGQRPDIREDLVSAYTDLLTVCYPATHRKYHEVCVFGIRRKERLFGESLARAQIGVKWATTTTGVIPADSPYIVPPGTEPKRWAKGGLTQAELAIAMHDSPTKKLFAPPAPRPKPRPGLQLGVGQRALMLAAGYLNTVLEKDGVRVLLKSSAYKDDFLKSETTEEVPVKGGGFEMKTTRIMSQRICLRVRALDKDGKIHDLK